MTAEMSAIDPPAIHQLSSDVQSLLSASEISGLHSLSAESTPPPLIVDLDGTLILTDSLAESFLGMLKSNPVKALVAVFQLFKGRAQFKQSVSENSKLCVSTLPYRADLLDYIRCERENGRRIVLATAAHRVIADSVADHLKIFDDVIASNAKTNLKGEEKLEAIRSLVGENFVYAGDSAADLPIWQASQKAIIVNTSASVTKQVRQSTAVEQEFRTAQIDWKIWFRALRCHQWLKNLLIFVPIFTSLTIFNIEAIVPCILAFFAFCAAASGTYIGNDLWDLDNDRAHPRKKHRPFASGQISAMRGVATASALLTSSVLIAFLVSTNFLFTLAAYVFITTAYSWALKRYVLIDVITLAILYTLRVFAGSVATNLSMTYWLFAFSIFTFFSLALVKRCAELTTLRQIKKLAANGRDYRVEDLAVLYPLGIAASLCSVVVFGLYIGSTGAQTNYSHPGFLWLAGVGLIYWISRLWIKTVRGEMHDDPIIFALKDFGSRVVVIGMILVTLAAAFFG